MDPVSAIVMATLSVGTSVIDLIAGNRAAKYGRLPDWLSPKDFQQKSYTCSKFRIILTSKLRQRRGL